MAANINRTPRVNGELYGDYQMAQYTITHACGHKDTIALFGPHAARDKRIEHMENELCLACWAEKSRNADVSHGLPALKGSDKQVAWASEIRQEVLPGITEAIAWLSEAAQTEPEHTELIAATISDLEAMRSETRAAWWIENRMRRRRDDVIGATPTIAAARAKKGGAS